MGKAGKGVGCEGGLREEDRRRLRVIQEFKDRLIASIDGGAVGTGVGDRSGV